MSDDCAFLKLSRAAQKDRKDHSRGFSARLRLHSIPPDTVPHLHTLPRLTLRNHHHPTVERPKSIRTTEPRHPNTRRSRDASLRLPLNTRPNQHIALRNQHTNRPPRCPIAKVATITPRHSDDEIRGICSRAPDAHATIPHPARAARAAALAGRLF